MNMLLPGQPGDQPLPSPMVYVDEAQRWEYKRLVSEDAPGEDELNALGAEGWELVSSLTHEGTVYLYFKRLAES